MAQMRLQAAEVARESAEEQYQSEQRQFRAGLPRCSWCSSVRTMITAAARSGARSGSGEAIAQYQLATGTILAERHINLK